jgi:hypothetical protein
MLEAIQKEPFFIRATAAFAALGSWAPEIAHIAATNAGAKHASHVSSKRGSPVRLGT